MVVLPVISDNLVKSKDPSPRESGGPEIMVFPGFPFPIKTFEDKFHGNDEKWLSAIFFKSIIRD